MKYKFTDITNVIAERPTKFSGIKNYISTGALGISEIEYDKIEEITFKDRPSRANLVANTKDILMAKMAYTDKRIVLDDITAKNIYSTGFFALRAKEYIIKPLCLYYLIGSKNFIRQKNKNSTGATQKSITNKGLSKIKVNIPNINAQDKIIDSLQSIEHIINYKKRQLCEYDHLIKSRFVEMFGNSMTNPKRLPELSWENVFHTTTGKLDSNAMVENGQYPFFTCAKESFWIDKYSFDCEALLLAGNNAAGIYDVKHYSGKFNAYQRTYVLQLKKDEWSYTLFKRQLEDKLELLRTQSKGSNTRYLTIKILNDLSFIIPNSAEQKEYSKIVQQVDKLKFEVQKSLDETKVFFDSLMQKYFG